MGQEDEMRLLDAERAQLFNVGYRMLGSVVDAEDVVQETYARWYALTAAERSAVDVPIAWLTKVASRICLDILKSARARRESYVGEWLPEPMPQGAGGADGRVVLEGASDPAERVTLDESVSVAFLVVLDRMTPAERVSFLLHDVFAYPFSDIAEIVGRTPQACRQLASSARKRVRAGDTSVLPPAQSAGIVREFKRAWDAADIESLIGLLDPEGTAVADGGGVASAILEPIVGAGAIARFFVDLRQRAPDLSVGEHVVNGQPGLVARLDGVIVTVFAFQVTNGRIGRIFAMRNPEKLTRWR